MARTDSLAVPTSAAEMAVNVVLASDSLSSTDGGNEPTESLASDIPVKGVAGLPEPPEDDSAQPDSTNVPNRPIGMAGARDVALVRVEDMPIVLSNDAVPAESLQADEEEEEGEASERWTGWTLVLSEVRDLETAQEVRDNLMIQLGQFGKPEIWTGTWRRGPGVVVAMGRLDSAEAARDLANSLGASLPQGAWILHIIGSMN
jgi:hypothetical protein